MTRLFHAARLGSLLSFKSNGAALLIAVTALMAGCGSEPITSIAVGPPDATLAAGLNSQYTATAIYRDGSKADITNTVGWSSSTPATATMSSTGLVTAVGAGTTTIAAVYGAFSATTTLTVTGATLVSIEVTPTNPNLGVGATEQFTATGVYSDKSTQNLTTAVTWSSATPGIATINGAGLATGVAVGSSVITATYQGVSGTTTLTVTGATLVSIGITPATATLAKGTTQPFVATGVYSDNSTRVLTTSVTWASSAPGVATISNTAGSNGLAKALAVGTASITASLGSITSPAVTLTVSPAALVSIGVTPASPSLPLGTTQQFVATGTYTDGSTKTITTAVTWTSSAPAIATINNSAGFEGLAKAVAIGTTAITATLGGVTSTPVTLTATAATLSSIGVTPANPTITRGMTEQFVAMGVYSDNTTQVLTTTVTWNSATPAVATISNANPPGKGLATSVTAGTTVITATLGGVTSAPVTLTVSPATLVSIAVTPATASIAKGLTQAFVATGTYSDATTQVITTAVTWASAAPGFATISNTAGTNGVAMGLAVGTTAITAALGTVTSTPVTLTVTAATLVSIAVTAPTLSVPVLLTDQFTATGTYTDMTTQDLTTSAMWASATPAVATISNANPNHGLATTLTAGTTVITATSGAVVSPGVTLTVTPAVLQSIAVTPASPSIPVGATQQFTATGTYNNNTMQVITNTVTWNSVTTATAQISNTVGSNGLATGLAAGTTAITAALGTVTSPAVTLKVGEYVYVTDYILGGVYEYSVGATGALTALSPANVATGVNPSGVAVDPTGHYLYVTNEYAGVNGTTPGTISQYTIGTNGVLTPMANATAGIQPSTITIDPTGKYAYIANFNNGGAGTVSQYTIGVGGGLVPMTPATVAVGNGPSGVTLDPTAAFAYVANYTDGTIMVFSVDGTTGALTLIPANTVTLTGPTTATPNAVVIDPTGSYLYVGDYHQMVPANGTIGQFAINPTTGALTPLATPYVAQGNRTISLHQSPTSAAVFVYASYFDGNSEGVYRIGTGGNLVFQQNDGAVGTGPQFIAFDGSGNYAYLADRGGATLSQFSVNAANGQLTPLTPATVTLPAMASPIHIATTSAY